MADRSVKVTVGANLQGLISEFRKGQKAATDFSQGVTKELVRNKADFEQVGKGLAVVGAAGALALGAIVSRSADFEQAMSFVQAATHETAGNMGLLKDAALEAGSSTVFSATESANAIEELSKAGLSTSEILSGGLAGSLDLAAAGGLEVADAAQQTAIALKQFGLDGGQASHVADLFAAGAGKAVGDVSDLSAALGQVGLVANGAGQSIEGTTGVLAAFADQGLLGSDAGTSLKSALIALQAPTDAARAVMEKYNLSFYDGNGQMLSYAEIAGQLSSQLGGLDDETRNAALAQIFGNDAIRSANVLYGQGAEGIQKYIDQTNDAGYAAETAAIRLDNLKGDVEALGGALDTALIKTGESTNGPLRSLTQGLTGAVEAYANLDPAVQAANLKIVAGITAVGTAGGAFLLAAPKVIEFMNAVDQLGTGAKKTSSAVLALGKAAGVATAVVGLALAADKLSNANDKAAASIEGTSKALRSSDIESLFSGLGQDVNSYAEALELLTGDGVNAKMERFGSTLNGALFGGAFSDQVAQTKDQIDTVGQSLGELVSSGDAERAADLFEQLAEKAAAEGVSRKELLDLMPAYRDAVSGVSTEQADAADTATQQAEALTGVSGAAQDATFDIDAASDAIRNFASATLDSRAAARDLEAAVDDVAAAVAENGTTLDINTSQGRANEAALDAVAESAKALAASTLEQTGSQEQASAALANGRQKLIESLAQFGITGQAAEDYADKLGLIPSSIKTTVAASTAQAQADLDGFITRNNGRVISVRQQLVTEAVAAGADRGAANAAYRAAGGPIFGPGTGTSDSIPAWLSNGEHVLTAREVLAAGGHGAIMALRRQILAHQGVPRFASGGPVGARVAPRYAGGGAVNVTVPEGATNVSLAGATLMLTIGGRQMEAFVSDQIVAADRQASMTRRAGKQVR